MELSDRNAVRLAELLLAYFVDCQQIDPSCPPASELTVQELLDDLASSTEARESNAILEVLDELQGMAQ